MYLTVCRLLHSLCLMFSLCARPGVEELIRAFADFNEDGTIEREDTDLTLDAIDTDRDNIITPPEFAE